MATADILSVCLIHKILCYLSYEEASRMRILSKTWLQAWSTLPNLKFKVEYIFEGPIIVDSIMDFTGSKIVNAIMKRYRDHKIPIDKFEFSNRLRLTTSDQFSPWIDKLLHIALKNGVKDIVYENPYCFTRSYRFPIIKVLAGKYLRELVLSGSCDLMDVSLSRGVANCHSLRKLSLRCVSLDENMLQTLLNSCPLIVSFILKLCNGLEKIEVLNLQKIKSISIKAFGNQSVKIQAPTLEHLSYSYEYAYSFERKTLDDVECQSLKSLKLKNASLSDGFLDNLISRSQFLKILKICYCDGIRDIDSSNLVSLEYTGFQIPELKMASESSKLKHSKLVLNCPNNLNAAWFCKLRKFLSNLTSSSQVSIDFSGCNVIDIKGLKLHHRVATPQVDILNVHTWSTKECPTFVDALLWSCHPSRLNLSSTAEMTKCFIDCLMDMKSSSYSSSQRSNSWHSQLKEILAFDGKDQLLQLKSGKLAIRTLKKRKTKGLHFLLYW